MGLLLLSLASCGSRKADGTPNASGVAYLYKAGTVQAALGYTDSLCTVPHTTTGGTLESAGAISRVSTGGSSAA